MQQHAMNHVLLCLIARAETGCFCACVWMNFSCYTNSVTFPPAGLLFKFFQGGFFGVILMLYTGKYGSSAIANILCYANVAM